MAKHVSTFAWPETTSLAHAIAGSCANLGASTARTLLPALEAAAKAADAAPVQAHVDAAWAGLSAVHNAILALRRVPPAGDLPAIA